MHKIRLSKKANIETNMMVINPLMPFFPDSISFLIYGLVTGLLLKFWRIAKRNIIFILIFLYAYAVWLASMALLMTVQSHERQAWFIFGFILTFLKIFSIIRAPFAFAFESIRDGIQEQRADRRDRERQEQRERENQDYQRQNQNQDLFREEQARREAEARANRAKQSGKKQEDHQSENEKIEHKTQQKQHESQEIKPAEQQYRSYEQILGLLDGWTEDDLKKAYQRECQRTHPDRWIGKPENLRKMMEEEYKAVQEAYRKLKK